MTYEIADTHVWRVCLLSLTEVGTSTDRSLYRTWLIIPSYDEVFDLFRGVSVWHLKSQILVCVASVFSTWQEQARAQIALYTGPGWQTQAITRRYRHNITRIICVIFCEVHNFVTSSLLFSHIIQSHHSSGPATSIRFISNIPLSFFPFSLP